MHSPGPEAPGTPYPLATPRSIQEPTEPAHARPERVTILLYYNIYLLHWLKLQPLQRLYISQSWQIIGKYAFICVFSSLLSLSLYLKLSDNIFKMSFLSLSSFISFARSFRNFRNSSRSRKLVLVKSSIFPFPFPGSVSWLLLYSFIIFSLSWSFRALYRFIPVWILCELIQLFAVVFKLPGVKFFTLFSPSAIVNNIVRSLQPPKMW